MKEATITLKLGRERPLRQGHPWIFSGAIEALDPSLAPGDIVLIQAADGSALGRGYVNPHCAITVRVLTRIDEAIDAAFLRRRVEAALRLRRSILPADTNAYRLINGEGDGLPGIIADVYADTIVLQCLTAGADALRPLLLEVLQEVLAPTCIFERSVGAVRREEKLDPFEGVRAGTPLAMPLSVLERGMRLLVDVERGQKTGFFLDQREHRGLVRELAAQRRVLNTFCYTGAFSVAAALGGAAQVISIDSSASALELAKRNWEGNPSTSTAEWIEADVFEYLRQGKERFDLVVLDPPSLVKRRHDIERGARAYKDLNMQGLRRAARGAFVLTFSCSQHMSRDLFVKVVHGAASDVGCDVQILRHLSASADHPMSLAHPEGEYFKGLLLHVR